MTGWRSADGSDEKCSDESVSATRLGATTGLDEEELKNGMPARRAIFRGTTGDKSATSRSRAPGRPSVGSRSAPQHLSRSVSGLQKQGSEFDGKIVLHASEGNGKDDKSLIFAAQI